ncbi:hypothetical protein ACQ4PT_027249 [Festuca glaucescens]
MVGHCARVCHCQSPAGSFAPPIPVHHSRSSRSSRSASKAAAPDTAGLHLVPRPIADLDEDEDESNRKNRYVGVAGFMFMSSVVAAINYWPDWLDSLVVAIMFSYWAAILLLFAKHCDNIDEQSCVVQTMLALTSIVAMSMALIVSTFPSKSIDASLIVLFSTVTAALCLSLLICWNDNREKERERKNASAGSEEKDLA